MAECQRLVVDPNPPRCDEGVKQESTVDLIVTAIQLNSI